jgi:hypothetical protein
MDEFFIDNDGYVVVCDPQHGHSARLRKATEEDRVEYAARHRATTKAISRHVETISDIVEELADRFEVYGSCDDFECESHSQGGFYCCRSAFVSSMIDRINEAYRVDNALNNYNRIEEMLEWFNKNHK